MGQNWRRHCAAPFFGGGAGSPSNTMSLEPRSISVPSGILVYPAICPEQTLAENWGLCPFWGGRAGSPSNTMWLGPRPTSQPSFILIHATVWPQYTNITDRQERQTDKRSLQKNQSYGLQSHACVCVVLVVLAPLMTAKILLFNKWP